MPQRDRDIGDLIMALYSRAATVHNGQSRFATTDRRVE